MSNPNDIRVSLNLIVKSASLVYQGAITDEDKLRIVTSNCNSGNTIVVRARILGQEDWDTLKTISGNAKEVVSIKTYDEIQLECTVYDSASSYVKVVAGSFNEAGGSTTIGASTGEPIVDASEITFDSSDDSINISTDPDTNTINLTVSATGGSVSKYTRNILLADWTGPSAGEYVISIPFLHHQKQNPVVTCYENNTLTGEIDLVDISTSVDNDYNIRLVVVETFNGKIYIN